MTDGSPVESVDRALRVLTELAEAGPGGLTLGELARRLGLSKPSAHRTLAALRHRDFAGQDPSGAYVLGPTAALLGERWFGEENLPALLHPALVALCARVDELVHLGVLSGTQVLYLDKVEPERSVRVWSAVGRRTPAVTTALGRAMLAHRGADGVAGTALDAYVAGSGADPRVVRRAVAAARDRGWAAEEEENEPGISCIGVPLLRGDRAAAAVSITAPAERMTPDRVAALVSAVREVLPPLLPPGLALPRL